jgi:hypothetical protein
VKRQVSVCLCALVVLAASAAADVIVFPTGAHAAFNYIPFANPNGVMHEVFDRALFSSLNGGQPVRIEAIAFAPNTSHAGFQYSSPLAIRLGLTDRLPGVGSGSGGLSIPDPGGNGVPNVVGAMTTFFEDPSYTYTVVSGGSENFEMIIAGTPFVYDPAQYNLLVEIVANGAANSYSVSRAAGSAEASRAYVGGSYTGEGVTSATRMQFTYSVGTPVCRGDCNCDGSISFADINPFVSVLSGGTPCNFDNCDVNADGVIDFADIDPFVRLLTAGIQCQ